MDKDLSKNNTPMVSVIMPTYNVEHWVQGAIRSILQQTYNQFELIVIDDGSIDNTVKKVKNINDPRLKLFQIEHQGLFRALNIGIKNAKGEWIARMDGDDISHPNRLRKQMDLISTDPDTVICGTAFGYISPNGRIIQKDFGFKLRELTVSRITYDMGCADASMVFRRDAANDVGLYDVDTPINEKSLWYKLLGKGRGVVTGKCYYFVRIREGSSNIGQTGGAERGRAARRRYDPKGYRLKYGNSELAEPLVLFYRGIRTKLWIFRSAKDYRSIIRVLLQTLKLKSLKFTAKALSIALSGDEKFNIQSRRFVSKSPNYVEVKVCNRETEKKLAELGLKINAGKQEGKAQFQNK